MICSKGIENRANISKHISYYNLKECKEMLLISYWFYERKILLLNMFQYMDPQIKSSWCLVALSMVKAGTVSRSRSTWLVTRRFEFLSPPSYHLIMDLKQVTLYVKCALYALCTLRRIRKLANDWLMSLLWVLNSKN